MPRGAAQKLKSRTKQKNRWLETMPSVRFAGGSAAWAGLISALCGVGRGQPTKGKWVLDGSWALSWGDRGH